MISIPETSLIPATLSLLRFYGESEFKSFFMDYPYWYNGEVPFKFLVGPITPILFKFDILLNNWIQIVLVLILISTIGWSLFFTSFFKQKRFTIYHLTFIIFLILPWKYVYGLAISDFTLFFAKSLIPFFLILLYKRKYVLSSVFLTVLLLINTSVMPSVLVFSLLLMFRTRERLKSLLYIFISSHFISLLWYGPSFWLRILMNPSIGGRVGIEVIFGVFNFFKLLLPVLIAFVVVKFSGRLKKRLPVFILGSIISFGILTLYRFIANPEFYMDYISWFYEFEVSISLLLAYVILKKQYKYILALLIPVFFTVIIGFKLKYTHFSNNLILEKLDEIANDNDLVFISGSPTFSVNQKYNIKQLRGGRDEVSKNKNWLDASYVFRESKDKDQINKDLKELKIKYVLVHTRKSNEFYKDFKNEEIWRDIAENIYEKDGDIIYKVSY